MALHSLSCKNVLTPGLIKIVEVLKAGFYGEIVLSQVVKFSFDSLLSTFNTCIQLQNANEIFQSRIMKVFQKKTFLPDF